MRLERTSGSIVTLEQLPMQKFLSARPSQDNTNTYTNTNNTNG